MTGFFGHNLMVRKKMDKKEINSPWLTLNFLIWVGGVGGVLLFAFIGHYVWRIF